VTGPVRPVEKSATVRHWYVTASHRKVRRTRQGAVGAMDVPFGLGHVRKVGSPITACGQPALDWPIFWDLSVNDPDDMCSECKWTAVFEDQLPQSGPDRWTQPPLAHKR
jgi:hypothetical protein